MLSEGRRMQMAEDRGDFFRFDYNFNPMSDTSPIPFNFIRQYFKIVDLVSNGPLSPNSFAFVSAFRVFPPKIFPPFRAPRKKKHESIYRELPAPRIFWLLETFTEGDRAYRRNRYDRLRPRPLPWSYPRLKHREKGSLRFLFCATIWKLSELWISRASRAEMNIRGFFSFFFFRRKQEFVVFLCFLTSLRN